MRYSEPIENQKQQQAGMNLWFFITILLIFIIAVRTPIDTDFWWHLKAGQYFVDNGKPLLVDIFSHTQYGQEWVNHSWFGQVIFYVAFSLLGITGVSLLVGFIAVLSMMLCWRMDAKSNHILSSLAIILGSIVASLVWAPRPQIFSLLFLSMLYNYLRKHGTQDHKFRLIAPVIFILWSNTHAGYPLGLIIIAIIGASELLPMALSSEGRRKIFTSFISLIALITLCFLVTAINPNTTRMWTIPFETVGLSSLQEYISEWASPDFHDLAQQSILWLLITAGVVMVYAGRSVQVNDIVLVIIFGYMTFLARRHCGPMAIIITPIIITYGTDAIGRMRSYVNRSLSFKLTQMKTFEKPIPLSIQKVINLGIVGTLGFCGILKGYIVSHPVVISYYERKIFPIEAIDLLNNNQKSGKILNEYNWGGKLIWSSPQNPVFIDGRTDLFGDEIITEWRNLIQAEDGWRETLRDRNIQIVLLFDNRPIVDRLIDEGWSIIYREYDQVLLFEQYQP